MVSGLIGKKLGMTQIFREDGIMVPATVIQAGPCVVVQKKTAAKEGYDAVQLGMVEFVKPKRVNQPQAGHYRKAGVEPGRKLREFKTEPGVEPASQSSELQLTASGDIRKYEWKEVSPGKAQAVVVPNDTLLIERSTNNPGDKPEEHPFLLPVSTSVLDDFFFIHREILAWKFLATGCRQDKGQIECPQNQQVKFGVINPHQRSSLLISMAYTGKEKIPVRGVERDLNHFVLKSDAGDWSLWLDDQFKLVRILVASDNTEVVRD